MEAGTLHGTELAGRYRIGALLGSGGMADVYDAVDLRLDRPVAVKVLRPAMAANPDVRRRFEAEARAAARLSHPNVVSVFDTGEDHALPFIVMERLPGETVADRIVKGPVNEGWLRRMTGDILLALAAAHESGLVHRDVKPGNVLIAASGCGKVADFGIAKSMEELPGEDLTATNMLVGTPAYLAPERIEGRPATAASDIYSVGVVMYEALAGYKPFSGSTPMAVANAIRNSQAAPLAEVRPDADPWLVALATKAMAPRPEERFASADEMRVALERRPDATVVAPAAAATTTSTMAADGTLAMAPVTSTVAAPAPAAAGATRNGAAAGRGGGIDRRLLIGCAVGLAALMILAAVLNLRGGHGSTAAASDQHALAAKLRDLGRRVHDGDGSQGPTLDTGLTAIAADLDAGRDAGAAATTLLGNVSAWRTDPNQLSAPAAQQSTDLLEQVPGVDKSAANPTPPATAPTTATPPTTAAPKPPATQAPAPTGGHGKKKK